MALNKDTFADLGAEPVEEAAPAPKVTAKPVSDFSDIGAEPLDVPESNFADLGAEAVEPDAPEAAGDVKDVGFFERIRDSFMKRQIAETEASQLMAAGQQAAALQPPPPEDPMSWSYDEFKERAPKPTNPQEKAVYNAVLRKKKEDERSMTDNAYRAIFETPAAANREAIRSGAKGESMGKGYEKGANNPEGSETFQDEALRNFNTALSSDLPFDQVFDAAAGVFGPAGQQAAKHLVSREDKETLVRFIAGTPASTLGLIADTATSPADLLLTILGEKALKYVGKMSLGGRTVAELANTRIPHTPDIPGFRTPVKTAVSPDSPEIPVEARVGEKFTPEPEAPAKPAALVDAENRRTDRLFKKQARTVTMLEEKIYNGDALPDNIPVEWIDEAKTRVLRRIDAEEQATGKLKNRQKQIRHSLRSEPFLETAPEAPAAAAPERVGAATHDPYLGNGFEGSAPEKGPTVAKVPKTEPMTGEPRYAGNINLDRLQTTTDAEKVIKETAGLYKDKINEQTRGKITHEETGEMAKDLGMSREKLLKLRKGRALNAEEALAARDILKTETSKVVEIQRKIAAGDNSDATLEEFRRQIVAQANVQKAVSGETAEAGRALSAHKVIAQEERVAQNAAKLTARRKFEKEPLESLLQKATRGQATTEERLRRQIGAVGDIDKAYQEAAKGRKIHTAVEAQTLDQETREAQAELLRRATKAGAKTTADITSFLVKAGLSDDAARAVVASATETAKTGSEFVQKKMTEALGDREITENIARRMSKIDLQDPVAVNRFIRDVTKAKTSDQVFFYFINSILSTPLTHIVNSTSNLARSLANPIYRAAGAAVESPKRLIGKQPALYAGEAAQELIGKLSGMKDGARRFLFTVRNGVTEDQITKFDMRPVPIPGKVGDIIGAPTRALSAEDEFFKAINSQGELRALAYREAKKQGKKGVELWKTVKELSENPTGAMVEGATKAAERQTFQDALGEAGNAYIRLRNKSFLKWITPFVKTPVNIAKEGVRTSPAGFLTAMKAASGAERSTEIGQAAVGTAASFYFAQKALENKLTGAAPRGEAEKKRFFAEGKKPYAIKIGKEWVEYRRIEPFATPIGIIADGYRLWREKDLQDAQIGEIAAEAAKLIGQNAVEKTFMQGLNNLVNAMEEPGRYGERFLSSYASAAVPFSGTVRAAANASDDVVRDPKNIVENIKAGLPGLSKTVRPRLDPFGQPAKKSSGAVERTLSPMQGSPESEDPIVKELSRLDVTIPSAGRKQGGVKLSDDEYFNFMQKRGQKTRERLEKIMGAPGWQYQNDETRKRRLEKFLASDKTNPKDVERTAGARVYDEISSKLAGMEDRQEKADYIVRLLEKHKISAKIARRLRKEIDV